MNNTMMGTCCDIDAQVPMSTSPPAQLAKDANIRKNLNISVLRSELEKGTDEEKIPVYFALSSTLPNAYLLFSTGAPPACQALQPPAIDATLV